MRRTYISPEYINKKVYGTYNMVEESNFFCAKMLDVEDSIMIENQNIVYYQRRNGEQLDLSIESTLPSIIYSSSDSKSKNHTLVIDDSQNDYDRNNNTKWILDISLKNILTDYIFSTMKRYRTFEGIQNSMTIENDVNVALTNYINYNVLNRYKLDQLILYISYRDLRNQSVLRYKNTWKNDIDIKENIMKKVQTETSFDGSTIRAFFNQEKSSSTYVMDYYFTLSFVKI
jgi:hypothetical protein